MGDVIPFPRKVEPSPKYTVAQLEQAQQFVNQLVARGYVEEFAFEAALQRLKIMRGGYCVD